MLFHVCIWQFLPILRADGGSASALRFWGLANGVIGGLRMPVLLTLSGLLMARRVSEGFASTRRGVVANLYLYVVWLAVYAAVSLLVQPRMPQDIRSVPDALQQLLIPRTTLWYVLALAFYTLLMTAVRLLPTWLVLSRLAGINVICFTHPPGLGLWGKILGLAVYFGIGVRLGGRFRDAASRAGPWRATGWVAVSLGLIYADRFAPDKVSEVAFSLARNVVVVFTAVTVMALLIRIRPLGRLGSHLGQRTLGVYVISALLVQLLVVGSLGPVASLIAGVAQSTALALLYPLLMTIVIMVVCLLMERLLRRLGVGWLFGLPTGISERLDRPSLTRV